MKALGWVVGAIFLAGVVVAGCIAVVNDEDSLGRMQLVSHEYDCDPYYEPCGGDEYEQWNSDQRNHNRRNRGAFSPGPFEDSPVDFRNNCISLDCGGRDDRDRRSDEAPAP